ncbi:MULTISPECIES: preprotein translocase subunit SecG [Bacillaceae]|uniref:preprotein translocase subunit SecG n=2 Tax=Bacilli TaxID=91061 RepID=UPI001C881755|nr:MULTISPECIES: preprotein translocase subunit SecG [Bacillaceae]
METFLMVLLIIDALAIITVVLLQSGKSAGLSGAITGGAEQLFGKQKARGIDAVFQKLTIVLAVLFFVLTILLAYVY